MIDTMNHAPWLSPLANHLWQSTILAAAAWLDPSVITQQETRYLSVDIDHGPGYGNTLTWTESDKPKTTVQPASIQMDLDKEKFYEMFVRLMSAPTRAGTH